MILEEKVLPEAKNTRSRILNRLRKLGLYEGARKNASLR
jgi:hypothetical protein